MKRLIIAFLILLFSIYLGLWFSQDPGYVLIAIHHWTIESTLWVTVVALLLLGFGLHMLWALCRRFVMLPKSWQNWFEKRRLRQAKIKTERGFIEFNQGDWRQAQKHLIAAAHNAELPLVNYLTAAQAADAEGDKNLRDQYLLKAKQANPEAHLAIDLVQAQFQIDNHDYDQALFSLQALQAASTQHPFVLKLLVRLHECQSDWPALYPLLEKIRSAKLMTEEQFDLFQHRVIAAYMQQLVQDQALTELKACAESLPKNLKFDATLNYVYCKSLIEQGEEQAAEPILRQCLLKDLDDNLLSLYAKLSTKILRIKFVESLLTKNPLSAGLYLCLGQIYASQTLWAKAQTLIEKSLDIKPSRDGYAALGQIFDALGNPINAAAAYRKGLTTHPHHNN